MKNVSAKFVEKLETNVSSNFFFENCAFYEIMWKNIVEWGRPQMTWCTRIEIWLPKATITHTHVV